MIEITDQIYQDVARLLLQNVGNENFFNGTIEYDTDDFYSAIRCTLIICREEASEKIVTILPVWWEYNLYQSEGEQLTDFSWNELNRFLV